MKMVMAVVPSAQAGSVLNSLVANGHVATFAESRGGFLRQAQHIILVATPEEGVEQVVGLIKEYCRGVVQVQATDEAGTVESDRIEPPTEVGGAAIFVWDLTHFETY